MLPTEIRTNELTLLVGPRAEQSAMLELAARLAIRGPVRVLDGGNSFDAYRVARLIRRQTPRLAEVLERIAVARAFTCYQVISLFNQTPASEAPQLVLDLLATFYDENVTAEESNRLLAVALSQLQRLGQLAPVVVAVRPAPQPERAALVATLIEAADRVLIRQEQAAPAQIRLFPGLD